MLDFLMLSVTKTGVAGGVAVGLLALIM